MKCAGRRLVLAGLDLGVAGDDDPGEQHAGGRRGDRRGQHMGRRVRQHAGQLGANAVVGARYDATEIMQGVTEVLAYGTAVVVEPAG